jgi:hypothetical protein
MSRTLRGIRWETEIQLHQLLPPPVEKMRGCDDAGYFTQPQNYSKSKPNELREGTVDMRGTSTNAEPDER